MTPAEIHRMEQRRADKKSLLEHVCVLEAGYMESYWPDMSAVKVFELRMFLELEIKMLNERIPQAYRELR
jgi:hypothetical protein